VEYADSYVELLNQNRPIGIELFSLSRLRIESVNAIQTLKSSETFFDSSFAGLTLALGLPLRI
jgi:hypothetical protein